MSPACDASHRSFGRKNRGLRPCSVRFPPTPGGRDSEFKSMRPLRFAALVLGLGLAACGGHDGGTDTDAGTGVASDTLCQACTVNADCHGGGLCVSNSQHTQNFCTQDCSADPCPTGYICTLDRTGTKHQCYPSTGDCRGV